MKFKQLLVASVLATAIPSLAIAASPTIKLPKQIQAGIDAGGLTLETSFPVGNSLTGLVLKANGKYDIVYMTKDAKNVISGTVYDEAGKNITQVHAERFIPKPDYTKLWDKMSGSAFVQDGSDKGNPVYVFFDVNCVFCHYIWKASQPYIKAGANVKWVPVAILRPDSTTRAANILESENPNATFNEDSKRFASGGLKPKSDASPDSRAKLAANLELMQSFGVGGTPAVVYKDSTGKVRLQEGMPRLSKFPEITGIPEQSITDPDLTKFK